MVSAGLREIGIAQVTVLVHHQHSHPVGGIVKRFADRVVRATLGVRAHSLELRNAPRPEIIRRGHAHSGKIMMDAHATNLDALSIQKEALVGIEPERPDAEAWLAPRPPGRLPRGWWSPAYKDWDVRATRAAHRAGRSCWLKVASWREAICSTVGSGRDHFARRIHHLRYQGKLRAGDAWPLRTVV